jgi:hypothetical protein
MNAQDALFGLLLEVDSIEKLDAEGFLSLYVPNEEIRQVYDFAISYWEQNGRVSAPTAAVLKETRAKGHGGISLADLLAEYHINIDVIPEESVEWVIEELRAGYLTRCAADLIKDLAVAITDADAGDRLDIFHDYVQRFVAEDERHTRGLGSSVEDLPEPLNWSDFWSTEIPEEQWLIEPLLPKGRQTALFAKAKEGKSLLLLEACAAAVTGRSVFGQPPQPSVRVVYLDLEMTEDDVKERLSDFGYGPDDDLSGLAYYQLPSLPPLDTAAGGAMLEAIVTKHRADLVAIDTMSRVVEGGENDADTYRDFYRHTGRRIKALRIALARLDHAGKTDAAGQRGSSGKNDDVDVVFELKASTRDSHEYVTLKRTHTRVPWVPSELNFRRETSATVFRHTLMDDGYPAGTAEIVALLDSLQVPVETTINAAMNALRGAGEGRRKQLVTSAVKARKKRAEALRNGSGTSGTALGNQTGNRPEPPEGIPGE